MDAMMHIYILSIYHISRYAHSIPSIEFYTLEGLLQGLPISRRVDFDYGSSSKSPEESSLPREQLILKSLSESVSRYGFSISSFASLHRLSRYKRLYRRLSLHLRLYSNSRVRSRDE